MSSLEIRVSRGELKLVSLEVSDEAFTVGGPSYEGQVQGIFCNMSFAEQKQDPSKGE